MRAASFKPKDYSGADPKVIWRECQYDRIGDLIHMDYIGPMPVDGFGGATGAHTFKDQATRWAWVWVSRTRSSIYDHLLALQRELTNYWRSALRRIRTDNAPEHISKQYRELAKKGNYLMEWSSNYTPQQNSIAERNNGILQGMARSALIQAGVGEEFWPFALKHAAWVYNRTGTAALDGDTPYARAHHGCPPDISRN